MDLQLKQRLVGITVIFSLAVIFLPMLLDGGGRRHAEVVVDIPPEPQLKSEVKVEEVIIEIQKKAEGLSRLEPVIVDEISDPPEAVTKKPEPTESSETEQPKPATKAKTETPKAKPAVKEQPAQKSKQTLAKVQDNKSKTSKPQVGGNSWVIQVGSFKDKSKAYKERDRLRKSKLSAVFIERYVNKGVPSYRVRMGPFLTKQKAKVVSNKILAKYNIKGLMMKYEK